MLEWLLAPIDQGRPHEVVWQVAWHARMMVLAWGFLAPLAVLMARFGKIMPNQNWPCVLDNPLWWRTHWIGQTAVAMLSVLAVSLVWGGSGGGWHRLLGLGLLGLLTVQVGFGIARGTKGGPTAPAADGSLRGDHYDMTAWRIVFETVHKSTGYAALVMAVVVMILGLWQANAPHWMWLALFIWWACLATFAWCLQKAGRALDTYQAIWGPSLEHPGNRRKKPGWGMRRPGQKKESSCSGSSREPVSKSSNRSSTIV